MLVIDGTIGEGGGQVLRTSLALSLLTSTPFRIDGIRAGRERPGLMRQHLTAVRAAAEVGHAEVSGAEIGSRALEFHPWSVTPGEYAFSVGSAGSATLVLQTVLPALVLAGGPSVLTLEGGTHNPLAPPFEFLERAYLPLVRRAGGRVDAALERPGFHPAGGGKMTVRIQPVAKLVPFDLLERGAIVRRDAVATVAGIPVNVAHRELSTVARHLMWDRSCLQARQLDDSLGPGNVVTIEIESENVTEVFTAFGEKRVRAEVVAAAVASEASEYLAAGVPVGRHLADQLLLVLAVAGGGRFQTMRPTPHTETQAAILRLFLQTRVTLEAMSDRVWSVAVDRA